MKYEISLVRKLLILKEPLVTLLGTEQVGKFRMERMGRVMEDFVKHTQ